MVVVQQNQPSQDFIDLNNFLRANKFFIAEQDKVYLEQYVVKGFPG